MRKRLSYSRRLFDGYIAIFDKAGLGKPAFEVEENPAAHFFKGRDAKKSDDWHRRLLRACCERPRNRAPTNERDELPSPHGFARAKDYIGYVVEHHIS
jgi:hypothetical protein